MRRGLSVAGQRKDAPRLLMPYRTFGIEEAAQYLHLERADIERLVKDQDIPFERHGNRVVFRKVHIDAWASPRILGMKSRRLSEYHAKSLARIRQGRTLEALMPELLLPGLIEPALPARTRASAVREMATLANRTGRVRDPAGLLAGLLAREELCSTGLPGGLALLHTRQREDDLFAEPFIALGRTVQPVLRGARRQGHRPFFPGRVP